MASAETAGTVVTVANPSIPLLTGQSTLDGIIIDCLHYTMSGKNIHDVLLYVLQKITTMTGCDHGFIGEKMTSSEGTVFLRFHALTGFDKSEPYIRSYLRNGFLDFIHPGTMHSKVLELGEPILCHDVFKLRDGRPLPDGHPDISATAMYPLKHNSMVIGALGVSNETSDFRPGQLEHIGAMVEVATAILIILLDKRSIMTQKNNFLANISHEVRTPLNGIVQCSSMLKDTGLNTEQKELVSIINACSIQLLDIANDILDYTKIMSGYLKLALRPMSFRKCVMDVIEMYHAKIEERGLALIVEMVEPLPDMVVGDSTRLIQILMNLLSNALKYTRQGSITLHIEQARGAGSVAGGPVGGSSPDTEYCTLAFSIKDTGIGIAADRIPHLFETFGHSESYLCSESGVGLGLPITEHLVQMHSGQISIDSKLGVGTEVRFNLTYQLYNIIVDKKVLRQYYLGKSMLLICAAPVDRRTIFECVAEYGLRPVIAHDKVDADLYMNAKNLVFDFIVIDEDQMSTDVLGRADTTIVVVDSLAKDPAHGVQYIARPVRAPDMIKLLNTTYMTRNMNARDEERLDFEQQVKIKILVAEDDVTNQKVLELVLRKLGYSDITMTNDGLELYMELLKNDYDIAFIDLKMPIMDGITAVKKFRSVSRKKIVLVALTASMTGDVREACYAVGMNGYITKPINSDELDSMLKMVVHKKLAGTT